MADYKKRTGLSAKSAMTDMMDMIEKSVKSKRMPEYIPSGLNELCIKSVGREFLPDENLKIINMQGPNKIGKTSMGAAMTRNFIWENDREYFNYPLFNEWPIKNHTDDTVVKTMRIISHPRNLVDNGPIWTEINKWWPKGRFTKEKRGQKYHSFIETDTGWTIDMLSNQLDAEAYEGPLIGIHWIDEPLAKTELFDAIMTRHGFGGLVLITQTPVNTGPMLSVLDDFKEMGISVLSPLKGRSIKENSTTSGLWNHKKTKRGVQTDLQIKTFSNSVSDGNKNARLHGIGNDRDGLIYSKFDLKYHVNMAPLDHDDERFKMADCFMVMDPHTKRFPALQWWALMPPDDSNRRIKVCYNEWPTISTFNGSSYDQSHSRSYDMSPSQLAQIIKAFDMTHQGFNISGRVIDPRFPGSNEIIHQMALEQLNFGKCTRESIDEQRSRILQDINFNRELPFGPYNQPMIYVMAHCKNTARAFNRHHWAEDGKNEAERYKDFIDTTRYFYSTLAHNTWISWRDIGRSNPKGNLIISSGIEEEFKRAITTAKLG